MSSHPVAGLPPKSEPKDLSDPALCGLCPKLCRSTCPVATATADEAATPTAMMQTWKQAQAGRMSWADAAESLALCTGCEACRPPCEFGQDVPSMLYQARTEAMEHGAMPASAKGVHDLLVRSGTPFGEQGKDKVKGDPDRDVHRKGRVLYWPGCRALARWPERIAKEMELLRALGADHVSLPSRDDVPLCCGGAAWVMGDAPGLQVAASGLAQYFNRQRTWVSTSSLCLRTVSSGWSAADQELRAEILHFAEYLLFFRKRLSELAETARSTRRSPEVVVHDACGLQRRLGRGDPVREVLRLVLGVDPGCYGPSPDRTSCCGGGDFFDLREPERAATVGAWTAGRASLPAGAVLVTGDSDCVESLARSHPERRVFDLPAFLLEVLSPVLAEPPPPEGTRASDGR